MTDMMDIIGPYLVTASKYLARQDSTAGFPAATVAPSNQPAVPVHFLGLRNQLEWLGQHGTPKDNNSIFNQYRYC